MSLYRDNALMVCPRCGDGLVLESQQLALHTCARCGGLWLGARVVTKLAAAAIPRRDWMWWRPSAGPCPECKAQLRLMLAGELYLDECPEHGVWFDWGELRRVLGGVAEGDHDALVARLRDVLAQP